MIRLLLQVVLLAAIMTWAAFELVRATSSTDVSSTISGNTPAAGEMGGPAPAIDDNGLSITKLDLAAFPQTLTRPIFFQGRTFPSRPKTSASQTSSAVIGSSAADAEKIKLLGVVIMQQRRRALMESSSGSVLLLNNGEGIDGWTVSDIQPNSVVLSAGATTASLFLYQKGQ